MKRLLLFFISLFLLVSCSSASSQAQLDSSIVSDDSPIVSEQTTGESSIESNTTSTIVYYNSYVGEGLNRSVDDPFGNITTEQFYDAFRSKYSVDDFLVTGGDDATVYRTNIGGVYVEVDSYGSRYGSDEGRIYYVCVYDRYGTGNLSVFYDVLSMVSSDEAFSKACEWLDSNMHRTSDKCAKLGSTYLYATNGNGRDPIILHIADEGSKNYVDYYNAEVLI